MVRFVHVAAAVAVPLVAGVRKLSSRRDVKEVEGVPVYNFAERLLQKEAGIEVGQQEYLDVFDWVVMLNGEQSDEAIYKFCDGEEGCDSVGHQEGVPFVSLRGTEEALEGLIKRHAGQIEFVEPVRNIATPKPMPVDDVQAESMWNLDKIGVGKTRSAGKGVHIYVFDTGVHVSHSDFGGRATAGIDTMQTGRVIDCSRGGGDKCAHDTHGHGTHCAGTAAGTTYGVAKQAKIYAAKVCCGGNTNIVAGLDWLVSNGKKPGLVTMSLGGFGNSRTDEKAVNSVVNRGMSVVVAAGNENDNACRYTFAFIQSGITVGSTTASDARSGFSNFGNCNDIYAPGSNIRSARAGGGSTVMSGTSMACPAVAGAAALLLEKNGGSSPASIKTNLKNGAKKGVLSGLKSGDPNELLYVGNI